MPSDLPPPPPVGPPPDEGPPPPPPPPAAGAPPPPEVATAEPLREPPRHLHPFSMIRGIQLRQLVGAIPALIIFAGDDGVPLFLLPIILGAVLVIVAVVRVLSWRRHTYEFAGGRIIERSGILSRNERALEIERIQQVDVERTLLDRVVGTCELRLETAADSGDAELQLRVVTVEEARRLRSLLAARVGAATRPATDPAPGTRGSAPEQDLGIFVTEDTPEDRAGEEVLAAVPLHHVALAAITGPRLLAIPAGVALLFSIVAENAAPDEIVDTAGEVASGLSIAGGVVVFAVLLVVSVVGAAIWGLVRDGGFTIGLRGSDLLVRRGLTTTRSATVPLRRVQRVTVRRRWVQQALGFASITVHSAGGGGGDSNSSLDRSLTVPLLPAGEVDALVGRLLDVTGTPSLQPHPPQARRRAVVRGMLGISILLVPVLAAAINLDQLGLLWLALPILLVGATTGLLAYRRLASGADDTVVVGRTGFLGSTTEISPLRKTQGTTVTSSFFQRRLGLATLAVHIAGPAGGIELQDLGGPAAERLAPTLHG